MYEKLENLRGEMSQYELSKRTGISEATLSRLESGAYKDTSTENACKIAKVLNMPIDLFLKEVYDSAVLLDYVAKKKGRRADAVEIKEAKSIARETAREEAKMIKKAAKANRTAA